MPLAARFARYFNPILAALKGLGGSARPAEVYEWIARRLPVSESERAEKLRSGASRFENDVAWARFYLVRSGYIDSSRWGVWSLTEQGRDSDVLSDNQIRDVIRRVDTTATSTSRQPPTEAQPGIADTETEEAAPEEIARGYRERTIEIMRSLPPSGFERLCQRLLRESGFQQVTVNGRSHDGGIDGIGVLQVGPFVSFRVLFQCKRWADAVAASVVRDLRGALMGRADKGLILTTSTFTVDAQAEAVREGASPIELLDGQGLVALLEKLEIGLIPRTTYEVDAKFLVHPVTSGFPGNAAMILRKK